MSTRRSYSNGATTPSIDLVPGSYLDEQDRTIDIPKKLTSEIRRRIQSTYSHNTYLTQAQMPLVVRYGKLSVSFDKVFDNIESQGLTTVDWEGKEKPHILWTMLFRLQSALDTLERQLAITVPSRRQQLTKAEDQQPPRMVGEGEGEPVSVQTAPAALRLA